MGILKNYADMQKRKQDQLDQNRKIIKEIFTGAIIELNHYGDKTDLKKENILMLENDILTYYFNLELKLAVTVFLKDVVLTRKGDK